jgi:hypothetical protein
MFQVRARPNPTTVDCDLRWDDPETVRATLKFEVRVNVDPGDTNAEIEAKAWKQADSLAEAFLKRER